MFLLIAKCTLYLCVHHFHQMVVQPSDSIRIQGSCYDISTGIDLKVRLFSLSDNKKILIGESDSLGKFDLQLPESTKYLFFESEGFKNMTIPVTINESKSELFKSKYGVTIPMSAKDSLEVDPINQLSLCFTVPDDIKVGYTIKRIGRSSRGTFFDFKKRRNPPGFILKNFTPGDYILTASSLDGRLLVNEELVVNPGLNFKSVVIIKGDKSIISNTLKINSNSKLFDYTVLRFAQSSYELNNETKLTLDSLYSYLLEQKNVVIHVTGYTDNVGEKNLNVALSEYRARTVANYLSKKGVRSDKIIYRGVGPDSLAVLNGSEGSKIKSRKVVIQVLRK